MKPRIFDHQRYRQPRSAQLAAVALTLLGSGCQDLVQVGYGICGNGVLERQAGEDCEPDFPDGIHTCIALGELDECRFSCGLDADGVRLKCPPGWGCGADDVCREPSGAFATPVSVNVQPLQWLEVGDFNGDGHDDVVWSRDGFTSVHFFDEGKPYDSVEIARQSLTRPVIEDLNTDGSADLLLPTLEGLAVYRGQSDDSLLPTPFLSYQLDVTGSLADQELTSLVGISANIIPDVVWGGAQGALTSGRGNELVVLANGYFTSLFAEVTYDHLNVLAGSVTDMVAGEFDETGDMAWYPASAGTPDELVVVFATNPLRATVVRPRVAGVAKDLNGDDQAVIDFNAVGFGPVDIQLTEPIVEIIGKLQLNPPAGADPMLSALPCGNDTFALADEYLDIVFSTANGLRVAFGRGDGTFHSNACDFATQPAAADNAAGTLPILAGCNGSVPKVLAVAQLDADGLPDLVHEGGIVFSRLLPPASAPALSASLCEVGAPHLTRIGLSSWQEVLVVDMNNDGHLDVAATTSSGGLDLITIDANGEGAYQNYSSVGRPSQLSVHDLDGDSVNDLTFVDDRFDGPDTLYVLFGEPLATPAEPLAVGEAEGVMLMSGFRAEPLDGVDDLVIIARQDETSASTSTILRFGAMLGRPDRQLQAAFQLNYPVPLGFDSFIPLFVAAGHFTDDGVELPPGAVPSKALAMVGIDPGATGNGLAFGSAAAEGNLSLSMITPQSIAPPFSLDDRELQAGVVLKLAGQPVDRIAAIGSYAILDNLGKVTSYGVTAANSTLELIDAKDVAQGYRPVYQTPAVTIADHRLLGYLSYSDDDAGSKDALRGGFIAEWAPHVSPASIVCDIGDPAGSSVIMAVQNMAVGSGAGSCTGSFTQLLQLRRSGASLTYDPASDVLFDPGPGVVITGYACIDNDLDADKEIAVLTLDYSATECDFTNTTAVARLMLLPTTGGQIGEPKLVAEFRPQQNDMISNGLLGFSVPGLDEPPLGSKPPMSGVGAGDFNGDGIDDLMIGAGGVSLLLLGQTVNQ